MPCPTPARRAPGPRTTGPPEAATPRLPGEIEFLVTASAPCRGRAHGTNLLELTLEFPRSGGRTIWRLDCGPWDGHVAPIRLRLTCARSRRCLGNGGPEGIGCHWSHATGHL